MNPPGTSNGWRYRLVRDAPGLSSNARLVGLTLATYCNRETGLAIVRVETLATASGLSRRAVQRALRELDEGGLVGLAPSARRCRGYRFEGRQTDAPRAAEGRQPVTRGASDSHPRGVPETPGTIEGTNGGNARLTPRKPRAPKLDPYPRPAGVPAQAWADFLTNRRRKRMPNTASAHKRLLDDLDRLADDEWPPGRLVEFAAARGWCGIYDPRTKSHDRDTGQRSAIADRSTAGAARRALAILDGARH